MLQQRVLQYKMSVITVIRLLVILSFIYTIIVDGASDIDVVTLGSAIKLVHKATGGHLHSHAIAWGSGSGQQSITATSTQSDVGSMWLVKDSSINRVPGVIGTPIHCGDKIRLEHVQTSKNLHSHLFKAPLSGNQEVSGFGDGSGNGDTGDNWIVVCDDPSHKIWSRGSSIHLQHADTNKMLSTADAFKFNTQNCGHGCPIMGQTEVSAAGKRDTLSKWVTGQGIYFAQVIKEDENDEL